MAGKTIRIPHPGTDQWGFRIGTRKAFIMQALEAGGKTKDEIRLPSPNVRMNPSRVAKVTRSRIAHPWQGNDVDRIDLGYQSRLPALLASCPAFGVLPATHHVSGIEG